jgi:uncharacterized protein (DUF2249 family)
MGACRPPATSGRVAAMENGSEPTRRAGTQDATGVTASHVAPTLSEEHAHLFRELSTRADDVLREADQGGWPERQLYEFVNYLQLEGLREIVDEEWLLFSSAYHASDDLARLRRDHLELRLAIDVLAQAAMARAGMSPKQLAGQVRDLLAQIREHLTAEERILSAASSSMPSTAALGARPHEWYSITEQSVIDLDRLPGKTGFDAVLDRLVRMRPGDEVELRGGTDPGPIWQRLTRANPGSYGSEALEKGPTRWRLKITRRSA